jgi:enoyl-CoA hydratase/carnithine racemase
MQETIHAIKEFNEDPDTVFTVLTGEGRFFSSGADVRGLFVVNFLERKVLMAWGRIWPRF